MKKHDAQTKVVAGILPVNLAAGAQQGDWVDLSMYDSLTVLYLSGAGAASQDVTVSLRQARSATGTGAKNLNRGQWYAAQHATALGDVFAAAGSGDGQFRDDGETLCAARVEVTADQLDVDGDYRYVQVRATDPGSTAKLASAVYVLRGARYAVEVPHQPTATA